MNNKTIPVTSPLLPPLEEFIPYLEKIWESRFLTNGGDMHHALEEALCEYLGVKHIVLFANATLALITALQALRVTGEVITTPYSFVATSHALLWNGLKPIFVDIDQDSMNLDPSRIEAAITPQTTAILPVHCYGNPCDVEAIQRIADIHHLKVIYDAAHAFAVRDAGGSVLRHGDLSILSFHATKVFNTFEGGAIICSDENTRQRLNHLKNFGFVDEVTVVMPGINGKLNEVGAAFGLLQLKHVDQALEQRREIAERYRRLRDRDVLVRRYFYPLISDFPMYHSLPSAAPANLPVARSISSRVLCLPIYPGLAAADVEFVAGLIASAAMPRRRASS
ncbi:DegT/DnrJ/EryC1/StrS family aminotransferase [Pseudomonas aeruginosa]|uniref:DegT/DnrJ/EryC1/StrS family aminotransferase n=1 Tax=Pseudomonas aeruginosa TaxID=287 RepID=UPI0016397346|nr:DegT/DnrJ/EryC1/StrS family aminotransferase [Pseudomonas aeruginosa]MBK1478258.1 DegT/DnrJ/EryC1/StrS family aminotransferase [Pseudomonas aeruginosa]MBK1589705.1 DegT/DnrJ/EryC1/StrS family aminotransferase [Pseudomonas aeruginosa]